MTKEQRAQLQAMNKLLREEQSKLLLSAAAAPVLPSQSTLQRVAQLELNIAAVEHMLDEQS